MIVIVIVSLIALLFAHYMWQREKLRREEQHERRMERFENLMELLKKQHSEQKVHPDSYRESDTTEDEQDSRS